jgi:elongation factor Ts
MADYTPADIKEVRELTGAGLKDVKDALVEAKGDKTKAVEILRIAGAKAAAKRGERVAAEGLVFAKIIKGGKGEIGYLIELNSETDFVAKSDDFIALANEVLDAVVDADADSVDKGLAAKTKSHSSVEEAIKDIAGTKLRENIVLKSVKKVEGEIVGEYLHKRDQALPPYVGVLVAVSGSDKEAASKVAAHLVGPLGINGAFPYATIDDVPADILQSEKDIVLAKNPGKPQNIVEEKIIPGALKAYYEANVLSEQYFGLDSSQPSIKDIIGSGKIVAFDGALVGSAV